MNRAKPPVLSTLSTPSFLQGRRRKQTFSRFAAVLLAIGVSWACVGAGQTPVGAIKVVDGNTLEIQATVQAESFDSGKRCMSGYHLIVWNGGRAACGALFETSVRDSDLLDAFENLGAKPGNALALDSWDERENPDSTAPDQRIQGPAIEILVRLQPKGPLLPLEAILEDPAGLGFDMRLGGHRDNIPRWKSGCIACLYSCPGSKVGNARYTVRDYSEGTTSFRSKPNILPADGSEVTLVLRRRAESASTEP